MFVLDWIAGVLIFLSGYEIWGATQTDEAQLEPAQVHISSEPVFKKGIYYRSKDGYFISNLSADSSTPSPCASMLSISDHGVPNVEEVQSESSALCK